MAVPVAITLGNLSAGVTVIAIGKSLLGRTGFALLLPFTSSFGGDGPLWDSAAVSL